MKLKLTFRKHELTTSTSGYKIMTDSIYNSLYSNTVWSAINLVRDGM